ncbi:MAG: hypothetical protein FWC41_02615 [Firmicutes bacterium]|nr:hypothetical protein [Bacillota bacterium]
MSQFGVKNYKQKLALFLSLTVIFSSIDLCASKNSAHKESKIANTNVSKKINKKIFSLPNFILTYKYPFGVGSIFALIIERYLSFNAKQDIFSEFLGLLNISYDYLNVKFTVDQKKFENYIKKFDCNYANEIAISETIIKAASSNELNVLCGDDIRTIKSFHDLLLDLYLKILEGLSIKKEEKSTENIKEKLKELIGFEMCDSTVSSFYYIKNIYGTKNEARKKCEFNLKKNIENLYKYKENINMLANFVSLILNDEKICKLKFRSNLSLLIEPPFKEEDIVNIVKKFNKVAGKELKNKIKLLALIKASTYPVGAQILEKNKFFENKMIKLNKNNQEDKLILYGNFVYDFLEINWNKLLS